MLKFLKKFFDPNVAAINEVTPVVDKILELEESVSKLSLEEMQSRVSNYRNELKELIAKISKDEATALVRIDRSKGLPPHELEIHQKLQSFLPEMFAMLREVNKRKLGKPHFRVQLLAATILAMGNKLTELKTGEGKTQVFHLPAALYGLTGRGSHVITVNDYLARRDGEYAGHAMSDLGIEVGIITPQAAYKFVKDTDLEKLKGEEAAQERKKVNVALLSDMKGINLIEVSKREAYNCDVVYGTNNEFGFDYLRDNMSYNLESRVQRELYFCIIDEADSILIDEARTPLIISAPADASNDLYEKFARIVPRLEIEKDYKVDEKSRSVSLTEEGVLHAEQLLGVKNIWEDYRLAHHLDNALKAEALFKLDDEYIVKNGEVLVVDEFTGRVLPGRRYSEGLHQAIEAKEGVTINRESRTMATITFQNFFRLYKILAGGSGTILTEAEEFMKIYNLESYVVPTNKPVVRQDRSDKIYKNKLAKFNAVAEEITNINEKGQPVLVGTASIEDSELLSRLLDKKGIKHEVLNAKLHEREAAIVAKAGEKSAVTVATNMAGRGTDIPLAKEVIELGGLYVIGTQRHEARRIDNQLRGRSGRQGDPGVSQFFVGLDDEIMRIQGGEIVQRIMTATKLPDDIPIQNPLISRAIETAQKRMEGHNFDIRKRLVDYDDVMNQQREIFYTRRYNLLRLAELSQDKDEAKQKQAKEDIRKNILDVLNSEIEAITNKHYFTEREDDEDTTKLIEDYLDLADDKQIEAAFVTKHPEFKSKGLIDSLKSIIPNNDPERATSLLSEIAEVLVDNKIAELGESLGEVYKLSSLQSMDELWTEHLDLMGDLREGIGLRGYAQRDPLVEYKNEGFEVFERFINNINSQIARRILKIRRVEQTRQEQLVTNEGQISEVLSGSREMIASLEDALKSTAKVQAKITNLGKVQTTSHSASKVGRNDPCLCGSGQKYKKCGMVNSPEHQKRIQNHS